MMMCRRCSQPLHKNKLNLMAYLSGFKMSHVAFVHYAILNPLIYTIIFNLHANHVVCNGSCNVMYTTVSGLCVSIPLSLIFFTDCEWGVF